MTEARQRLGRVAEELAVAGLVERGWIVLARNARVRDQDAGFAGELDIVASDRSTLVVVEVRARREASVGGPEGPVESVGPLKRRRLRLLARAWLAENAERLSGHDAIRFDVIGIVIDLGGRVRSWEHVQDAF